MIVRLICVFVFGLFLTNAQAHGDEDQIREMYRMAAQDIEQHVKTIEANLGEYNARHGGEDHSGKFRSGVSQAVGRTYDITAHLNTAKAAKKRVSENLNNIRKIDNWVGVLREQAAEDVKRASTAAWRSTILLTHLDIMELREVRDEVCKKGQEVPYEGDDPGSAIEYYRNEKKFGPIIAKNLEKRIAVTRAEVQRLEAKYKQYGENIGKIRERIARIDWRWVHYYEDNGFEDYAKSHFMHMLYRYGYANRPRPEFRGNSFNDSDLNWYISYPFSQDRFHGNCSVGLYQQGRNYDWFHKLNRFTNTPIEAYDPFQGTLRPIHVTGTPMERMAKLLSKRLVQLYRLENRIDQANKKLSPLAEDARRAVQTFANLQELQEEIRFLRGRIEPGAGIADQIAEAEEKLADNLEKQKNIAKRIADKKAEIKAAEAPLEGVRIMPDGRGGWRKANEGETGQSADAFVKSLSGTIQNIQKLIDQAKADLERALEITNSDLYGRSEATIARETARLKRIQAELDQIEKLRKPPPPDTGNLIDMVEEEGILRYEGVRLQRELDRLKAQADRPEAGFFDADDARYGEIARDYRLTVSDLKKRFPNDTGLASLPDELPDADTDVINLRDTYDDFLELAPRMTDEVREVLQQAKQKLEAAVINLRLMDKKHTLLVSDVATKRLQAAQLVPGQIVSVGAREDDELVEYMKDARKAFADSQKILDVITSRQAATDAGLEAVGVSKIERDFVKGSNQVLDKLFELPDFPGKERLKEANEHIGNAKTAIKTVDNIAKYLELGAKFRADLSAEEPTMKDAFNYLENITAVLDLMKDNLPIGGQAAGYYLDYMGKSIKSIRTQAETVQKRVLDDSIRLSLPVEPERHLYTAKEAKAELPRVNVHDLKRALTVLQARRLVALMSARNLGEACERGLYNRSTCTNLD